MHAPGDDHVDGEAGFETLLACQLSDAAAALEDGLEHLEAFVARIPGDTLESITDSVDRNGSHQHPIDGRDACRGMAFPGPNGPQAKIGPGCKGGKAHAQSCGACRPRALKRNGQRHVAGLGQALQVGLQMRLVALGADERVALLLQGLLEERVDVALAISDGDDARLGAAVLGLANRRPCVFLRVGEGRLVLFTEARGLKNAERQALRAERQGNAQPQSLHASSLPADPTDAESVLHDEHHPFTAHARKRRLAMGLKECLQRGVRVI